MYQLDASIQHHPGIIVVGHSMGGLVARMAVSRSASDADMGKDRIDCFANESPMSDKDNWLPFFS